MADNGSGTLEEREARAMASTTALRRDLAPIMRVKVVQEIGGSTTQVSPRADDDQYAASGYKNEICTTFRAEIDDGNYIDSSSFATGMYCRSGGCFLQHFGASTPVQNVNKSMVLMDATTLATNDLLRTQTL